MMMNVVDTWKSSLQMEPKCGQGERGAGMLHSDGREDSGAISPERRHFRTASMSKSKDY